MGLSVRPDSPVAPSPSTFASHRQAAYTAQVVDAVELSSDYEIVNE